MAEYKPTMDEVVVKRYLRDGDGGDDRKYYLSLLFLKEFSISEIFRLHFFSDTAHVDGYSCHDWLCFENCHNFHVAFNITTKQVKFLPPPPELDDRSYTIFENGTGIGYDSTSDDYKVVRNLNVFHPDGDQTDKTELYSLKYDSFKKIPSPEAGIFPSGGGVYVRGSFYWVAWVGYGADGIGILRFDFAKETYSTIHLPPDRYNKEPLHYVVECEGCLGVITFPNLKHGEFFTRSRVPKSCASPRVSSKSSKRRRRRRCFELWVWKDMSLTKLYDASLHYVRKPLRLIDGRVSIFQGRTRGKQCDLVIYDWATKEMKRLDIYDHPGHMQVFCNLHSGVQLPPDAKPMNGLYTEETKTKTKAFLRACVRQNAFSVQDEAKPIDTIGGDKNPHFIAPGNASLIKDWMQVVMKKLQQKGNDFSERFNFLFVHINYLVD